MLEIRGLKYRYGRTSILDSVDLTVEPGEICALVAPNGSGKTTLMRAIARRLQPTQGSCFANGVDALHDPNSYARTVLYVPDGGKILHAGLTVKEHLQATKELWGSNAKLESVIKECHLESMLSKTGNQLSQGMKQQVSLAIACTSEASYILFDEPTNGFDQGNARRFRRIIEGLAEKGYGILISSHILNELDEMCDSTYFLKDGRLIRPHNQGYQGSCSELYEKLYEEDESRAE